MPHARTNARPACLLRPTASPALRQEPVPHPAAAQTATTKPKQRLARLATTPASPATLVPLPPVSPVPPPINATNLAARVSAIIPTTIMERAVLASLAITDAQVAYRARGALLALRLITAFWAVRVLTVYAMIDTMTLGLKFAVLAIQPAIDAAVVLLPAAAPATPSPSAPSQAAPASA